MSVNSDEYKSKVGLDSLYVAVVSADTAAAYTAGTPAYLAPAAELSLEPTVNSETQYADDNPFDVAFAEGETKFTIKITNYDPATLATILGKNFDATNGRIYGNNATPPYVAISFRSMKSNGKYRYFQYLKGRFEPPAEEFSTKGETPEPKPIELTYTAIFTTYVFTLSGTTGKLKYLVGDEDTTNFVATGWFTTVQTPSYVAPSALALSSSTPTDGTTGISVSANQTLTFNNALQDTATAHVFIIKAADGVTVAMASGYPSLDATKKIMTLDPNASLIGSTPYIIVYAVTDIYGQTLNGAVNFTTV
jgi:phi13 family phage major tail protein